MILVDNREFLKTIERYCKVLGELEIKVPEDKYESKNIKNACLLKEEYEKEKSEIKDRIFSILENKISDNMAFSIALFVYRSDVKKKIYDNGLDWSGYFKICNYLFFMSLEYLKTTKRTFYIAHNDRKDIKDLFCLGYTFFKKQILFNEYWLNEYSETTEEYYEYIRLVSSKCGDLNSYQISNADLQRYTDIKGISVDKLNQRAFNEYPEKYISQSELKTNPYWEKLLKDNLTVLHDDVVIAYKYKFSTYDSKFCDFINNFSSDKACTASDSESELIFSYTTDKFICISKKILNDTQTFIENFFIWGQYENLLKYFFGVSINQTMLRDYNRLMTYKIADILMKNEYNLPMCKVEGLSIPRIEISDYTDDKNLKNKLGDIDLLFYSKYTRTLYIIEYKNYQMIVSKQGDLSAEISKVEREKTPEKVMKRHKYIFDNISCLNNLFKREYSIQSIKSIILTTKPCYYFYINKSEDYDYMDWVEFEKEISNKYL